MSARDANEQIGFDAIWKAIRGWDIQREPGALYHGPTGDDVRTIIAALNAMSDADRIALARALVPDGWVVVKLPEEKDISGGGHGNGYNLRAKMGWNACRAAMIAAAQEETT